MFTLNCKGKLINTATPLVMGIINATPDSFYKSDLPNGIDNIIALATKMINDGATILDVGGQSTKPGATPIGANEEIDRVLPIVELLNKHFSDTVISIDTYHSQVAKAAVAAGASMVNDISAGQIDAEMILTVGGLRVPYICMHIKGTPQTMQQHCQYNNVVKEIMHYFIDKKAECTAAGIKDFIIDPGFGFAKNITQNFTLLKHLHLFKILDSPILAGLSRKSTIYKTLGITPSEALNGTTVLNTLALNNGANILRVHDVREAVEAVKLVGCYKLMADS